MRLQHDVACATILVAALLGSIARAEVIPFNSQMSEPQNLPTDRPEANPTPREIVTIRGQKDRRIEAWFVMYYSTTNETCRSRTTSQYLSGSPKIAQAISNFVRVPAGQTTFSIRFALDRYAPGRCGWAPIAIGNTAFLPEESRGPGAIGGFAAVRVDGSDHIATQYNCRRRVAPPNVQPHFYLECLLAGPSIHARNDISSSGATADVEFRLDTSTARPVPKDVVPPAHEGI
jgi:hypothetical protein